MDPDAVFRALGDPNRRRILDALHRQAGQSLGALCDNLDIRRQSTTQHIEVLEGAGLVTSVRDGRRKLHYLNPVPIHEIQRRWIRKFEEPALDALEAIKRRAEETAMTAEYATHTSPIPDYVYTTYIRATPEQVWHALTDPELTSRFWGHAQVSDWTVGSQLRHERTDGSGIADAVGTVVEVDHPRRLSFGFDSPSTLDDPDFQPSLVSFDIQADRDIVKLVVTHARLQNANELQAAGEGWAAMLANLKTFLETGDILPQYPWEFHADLRASRMAKNG